jgi:hypothetical protein
MGWEPTQTPAMWKVSADQSEASTSHEQEQQQLQQNKITTKDPNQVYTWVPYTGSMPSNAIAISNSFGKTFCVARGNVEGGIHPGYCDPNKNRCYTSYGGKEVVCEKFEILTADLSRVQWVRTTNSEKVTQELVVGGYEKDGTPTYCCKCDREGIPFFGKTYRGSDCAYYGFDDKEYKVFEFEILTVN